MRVLPGRRTVRIGSPVRLTLTKSRVKVETLADKFSRIDFEGVKHTAMKRTVLLALAVGLATSTLAAQTAPAAQAAAPAGPPQAIPAKIAIIAFQQGMLATNAAQRAMSDLGKKYEPQKAKLTSANTELDSLKKQLQALAANAPDEQRKNLINSIDAKEKQLNLDAEQAQTSYNDDLEKTLGPLQQAFGNAAVKYCQDNGFTILISPEGAQQAPSPVLWWDTKTDITMAVINAYNASSGVAAPPSAPSAPASRPRPTAPAGTRK